MEGARFYGEGKQVCLHCDRQVRVQLDMQWHVKPDMLITKQILGAPDGAV